MHFAMGASSKLVVKALAAEYALTEAVLDSSADG